MGRRRSSHCRDSQAPSEPSRRQPAATQRHGLALCHPEVKYGHTGPPKVLLGTLRNPAGTVAFALAMLAGLAAGAVVVKRYFST